MHKQTASKLLYDAFCFNINKKELEKYITTPCIPKSSKQKKLFFSLQYIRMSRKNINFDDKKKNQKKQLL